MRVTTIKIQLTHVCIRELSVQQSAKDMVYPRLKSIIHPIHQQWGVVRHGTSPLKSKISNYPPPKISAGHGRYPPPSGPENFDPP